MADKNTRKAPKEPKRNEWQEERDKEVQQIKESQWAKDQEGK